MKDTHKNLNSYDHLFLIEILPENKFFGINGMIELSSKLPNGTKIIVSQFTSNICKLICTTQIKSDLAYINENYEVTITKL